MRASLWLWLRSEVKVAVRRSVLVGRCYENKKERMVCVCVPAGGYSNLRVKRDTFANRLAWVDC